MKWIEKIEGVLGAMLSFSGGVFGDLRVFGVVSNLLHWCQHAAPSSRRPLGFAPARRRRPASPAPLPPPARRQAAAAAEAADRTRSRPASASYAP